MLFGRSEVTTPESAGVLAKVHRMPSRTPPMAHPHRASLPVSLDDSWHHPHADSRLLPCRSPSLVNIAAQHRHHSAIVAESLSLPHRDRSVDFAICIAVVHHLSKRERRVDAVREILRVLRRDAQARRETGTGVGVSEADSAETHVSTGRDETGAVNVAVEGSGAASSSRDDEAVKREVRVTGQKKNGRALIFVWALEQKGSRRGWDVGHEQDVLVPWVLKDKSRSDGAGQTFQRYYHLYAKGELQSEVCEAGGRVVEEGYDRDKWWVIIEAG
jgi:tRNA (uracil-5-)-methyltransferase TRM9